MNVKNIAIIGTGNVGSWFYTQLSAVQSFSVANISGRLASSLSPHFDLYIFALKDEVYETVLAQIPFTLPFAVHTSGSLSQQILAKYATQYGVLYPFQTLSKGYSAAIEVPLCVEGCTPEVAQQLLSVAETISPKVSLLEESQRFTLHLAGVFANNFTNAMYRIAHQLVEENGLSGELLQPLIAQTAAKVQQLSPAEAQTGPAARHDKVIIEKHLQKLKDQTAEKEIYQLISQWIEKQ